MLSPHPPSGDGSYSTACKQAVALDGSGSQESAAERDTFSGLAGIGDLITTCISPYGRNRAVGEAIGQGKKLAEVLEGMDQVAEGIWTTRSVNDLAERAGVDMPITGEVFRVLFEDKSPLEAVNDLMLREPKAEAR